GRQGGVVVVGRSQFEQFERVGDTRTQVRQGFNDGIEGFFFAAQVLGVLGSGPDRWIAQFGVDVVQAFGLQVVVKDTSVAPARALRSRRGGRLAGSGVRLP